MLPESADLDLNMVTNELQSKLLLRPLTYIFPYTTPFKEFRLRSNGPELGPEPLKIAKQTTILHTSGSGCWNFLGQRKKGVFCNPYTESLPDITI